MDIYGNNLLNTIVWNIVCIFLKLCRHVNYDERMTSINYGGQRSRSQWANMDITLLT